MNEEEIIEKLSNYLKDSIGKDLIKALKTTLDKLQKDNYKLDRENQHFFDRIQDLQKENEELHKQVDIEFVEENYIEKSKAVSKNKIRNKIKELEEKDKASPTNIYGYGIKFLKELLGE